MTDPEVNTAAAPTALVELSATDSSFAQLVNVRHARYRRSTTGGIQDEILELWADLRDLGLTIARVVPVRSNEEQA